MVTRAEIQRQIAELEKRRQRFGATRQDKIQIASRISQLKIRLGDFSGVTFSKTEAARIKAGATAAQVFKDRVEKLEVQSQEARARAAKSGQGQRLAGRVEQVEKIVQQSQGRIQGDIAQQQRVQRQVETAGFEVGKLQQARSAAPQATALSRPQQSSNLVDERGRLIVKDLKISKGAEFTFTKPAEQKPTQETQLVSSTGQRIATIKEQRGGEFAFFERQTARPPQPIPSREPVRQVGPVQLPKGTTAVIASGGRFFTLGQQPADVIGPPTREQAFIGPRQRLDDPVSKALQSSFTFLEREGRKAKDKNPLASVAIGAGEEILSIPAFASNLGRELAGAQKQRPPSNIIELPKTGPSEAISGPVEGIFDAFSSGNIADFFKGVETGAQRTRKVVEEQGIPRVFGQFIPIVAPIKPSAARSVLSAGAVKIPVQTTKGVKAATVARSLTVGPGERPIITRAGGQFVRGAPDPKLLKLERLAPTERGFEFGGRTKLEQRILLSDKAIEEFGKTFAKADVLKIERDVAKVVRRAPTRITGDLPEQPVAAFRPGKETEAALEFFITGKGKKDIIKGGLSQIAQVRKGRRQTSDIDIDIGPVARAQGRATAFRSAVAPALEGGRSIVLTGSAKAPRTKVQIVEGGRIKKAVEFLTERDTLEDSASGLTKASEKVFGQKLDKSPIKSAEGLRLSKLTTQTLTKIRSVGGAQGPGTTKAPDPQFLRLGAVLPEKFIGPPEFRLKDVVDQVDNLLQLAENYARVGKAAPSRFLIDQATRLERLYPEIDFPAARRVGAPTTAEVRPSVADSIFRSFTSPEGARAALSSGVSIIDLSARGRSLGPSIPSARPVSVKSVSSISKSLDSILGSASGIRPSRPASKSVPSVGPSISRPSLSGVSKTAISTPSIKAPSLGRTSIRGPSVSKLSVSSLSPSSLRASPSSVSSLASLATVNIKPARFAATPIRIGAAFDVQRKPKKARRPAGPRIQRLFVADPADPFRPGVIAAEGVQQLVSRRPGIFKTIDIQLGRARQRAQGRTPRKRTRKKSR